MKPGSLLPDSTSCKQQSIYRQTTASKKCLGFVGNQFFNKSAVSTDSLFHIELVADEF